VRRDGTRRQFPVFRYPACDTRQAILAAVAEPRHDRDQKRVLAMLIETIRRGAVVAATPTGRPACKLIGKLGVLRREGS
jgi:hypothetical protein